MFTQLNVPHKVMRRGKSTQSQPLYYYRHTCIYTCHVYMYIYMVPRNLYIHVHVLNSIYMQHLEKTSNGGKSVFDIMY